MFDPYHKWLGIPPKDQPPDHYRLLGLSRYEPDPEVIDAAANRQMAYLQACANGPHASLSQRLLNEVAAARLVLLDPARRAAYDATLKKQASLLKAASPSRESTHTTPAPPPIARSAGILGSPPQEARSVSLPRQQARPAQAPVGPLRVHGSSIRPEEEWAEDEPTQEAPYGAAPGFRRSAWPGLVAAVFISMTLAWVGLVTWKRPAAPPGVSGAASAASPLPAESPRPAAPAPEVADGRAELRTLASPSTDPNPKSTQAAAPEPTPAGPDLAAVPAPEAAPVPPDDAVGTPDHEQPGAAGQGEAEEPGSGPVGLSDVPPGEARRLVGHVRGVMCVAFTRDGRQAISGGRDGTIRVWDLESGAEVRRMEGLGGGVWSLSLSGDGKRLASSGPSGVIAFWDFDEGRLIRSLTGHTSWVSYVAISPDASLVLSGSGNSADSSTRLWSTATGKQAARFPSGGPVAFSGDGQRALLSDSKQLRLWDVEHKREIRRLGVQKSFIRAVAFSPDGRSAVSSGGADWNGTRLVDSKDHSVRVWDLRTGRQILRMNGHRNWVNTIAYSPDGRMILSGSGGTIDEDGRIHAGEDTTVRLWDATTGVELLCWAGHNAAVTGLAFSPDGRFALSGSEDGTGRLWRLPDDAW